MSGENRPSPERVPESSPEGVSVRKPWIPPEVSELPRLTDLTLQTGGAIGGGGGTSVTGSTVF